MWTSQHQELSSDSLTTVIVLAQKLKLHNPVLTAVPGVHEEMCLQTTRRKNKIVKNSNNDIVDSSSWEKNNTSTSASSTLSSVCDANDKSNEMCSFLRRKQQSYKVSECGNQKLDVSTSYQLQQYKIDQISSDSHLSKQHLATGSSSPQRSREPLRNLESQRHHLHFQTAVDIDTEDDTDTETSNDAEIICTSDDELKSFGLEATSNSDYEDAFESVSDTSAKEDNGKSKCSSGKSMPTSSYNQREILSTHMSPSQIAKQHKENFRGANIKRKPTAMASTTPPNSSSPLMPFRHPHRRIQDLETKFCRFSPLRQRTGKNGADSDNQSLKTRLQILGKTQISDHQDDGLGASVDDNDDDITLGDALCKPDSLNAPGIRKKRNDGKKSRNLPVKKQGDANGSDTSNSSSSSSLSCSPFTKFSPADTSSPLSQHANMMQHGGNSDQKEKLEISNNNGSCPINKNTDFGQKLDLLQSELVQLRHHDEKLARQFLQIYRDIQILKVQRACLDHQDLLDDAIEEVEERDRLLDLCDTPPLKHSGSKLRHCGLTKMNICSRRFSCS